MINTPQQRCLLLLQHLITLQEEAMLSLLSSEVFPGFGAAGNGPGAGVCVATRAEAHI